MAMEGGVLFLAAFINERSACFFETGGPVGDARCVLRMGP